MLKNFAERLAGKPREEILSFLADRTDYEVQEMITDYNPDKDPFGPLPSREVEILGQNAITTKYRRKQKGSFNPVPPEPTT